VYISHTQGYTQGVYLSYPRGIPRVYTSYYPGGIPRGVHLLLPGWYTLSGIYPPYTPWVHHPACTINIACTSVPVRGSETKPWAQGGRFPWVRDHEAHRGPKSVREEGRPLRRVTPLFPLDKCKRSDRRRVYSLYSPMYRPCCAAWYPSFRPSDR